MFYLMMALSAAAASCLLTACGQRGQLARTRVGKCHGYIRVKKLPKAEDVGNFKKGEFFLFSIWFMILLLLTFCNSGKDRWTHCHTKAKRHI